MIALIILTISSFANLLLGLIILLRSSRRPVYIWYAVLSIITVSWIVLNIFTGWLESILIFRLTYTIGALLPFISYCWYQSFQRRAIWKTKKQIILILITLLFSIMPLINGLIVSEAYSYFLGGINGKL